MSQILKHQIHFNCYNYSWYKSCSV